MGRKAKGAGGGQNKIISASIDPDVYRALLAEVADQFSNISEIVNTRLGAIYRAEHPEAFPVTAATVQRDRKSEIENELLEIKLARERRDLVSRTNAMAVLGKDYAVIRSRLMALPQSVVGLTPEQMEDLSKSVQDCMTDLSGEQKATWDDLQ